MAKEILYRGIRPPTFVCSKGSRNVQDDGFQKSFKSYMHARFFLVVLSVVL